jgi:2'-5' RNA ligase
MKTIKMFEDFITEKKGDTYEYGCAMLYFDFPKINEIHALITEEDLYVEDEDRTYGLEDEPHVTLLYGLHNDVSVDRVKELVGKFQFNSITLHNASLFENEYDVLKFDVKGGEVLHDCNKALCELPHTTSFPDYHPHSTIAYIKKGMGVKYVKLLDGSTFEVIPTHVVYSHANGEKTEISL